MGSSGEAITNRNHATIRQRSGNHAAIQGLPQVTCLMRFPAAVQIPQHRVQSPRFCLGEQERPLKCCGANSLVCAIRIGRFQKRRKQHRLCAARVRGQCRCRICLALQHLPCHSAWFHLGKCCRAGSASGKSNASGSASAALRVVWDRMRRGFRGRLG